MENRWDVMTPHISAIKEDIASIVIMPGDPLKAKYIAEKYLDDVRLVNNVRMMLAYTGYYQGKQITIMGSGMGMPSMGIYAEELYRYYDVAKIIRIGSCGSYKEEIKVRDIILVEKAFTLSNFAYQKDGVYVNLVKSSSFLNQRIIEQAFHDNTKLLLGNINSSDVFYSNYDDKRITDNYCLGVEMESFALFYIAAKYTREAATVLTVSDNLVTNEALSSLDRQSTFDEAILLVLNSLK